MSTVHVEAELTSDELLRAIGQLRGRDFDLFLQRILALRAERKAPSLSKKEALLLQVINTALSTKDQARYDYLINRRWNEQLTSEEHAELLSLTDQIEAFDAKRAEAIGQLALLRKAPIADVLSSLGLKQ